MMKVELSQVQRIRVSEVKHFDSLTIYVEGTPPRGKLTIEQFGEAWSATWGGISETNTTVADFVVGCDVDYVTRKLANGLRSSIIDPAGLLRHVKEEILCTRQAGQLSKQEARDLYDDACRFGEDLANDQDPAVRDFLSGILGVDFMFDLPEKPNPDWVHLERVVQVTQEALRSLGHGKARKGGA